MIINILNRLNKSKETSSYIQYAIHDNLVENFNSAISSSLLGDDIVSLFINMNSKRSMFTLSTPQRIKLPLHKVDYNDIPLNKFTNVFQIEMSNNNFFPLDINVDGLLKIFNEIINIDKNINLSLLLMLKESKNADTLFLNQYEQFLYGIDNPSSSKIMSFISSKFISNDNIRELSTDIINSIEKKITDKIYQFQLFIDIANPSNESRTMILDIIESKLHEFSYLNDLIISPLNRALDLASNFYDFNHVHNKQYISLSEIQTLLFRSFKMDKSNVNNLPSPVQIHLSENKNNTHVETNNSNSSLIELLPKQIETHDDDVDESMPNKIKDAMRRVKVVASQKINVLDFLVDSSLIKVTTNIPKDKTLTDITKKEKDIQAVLGVNSLSIVQGDQPDSVSFFIPREKRQPIYLRPLLETEEFAEFCKKYPLPFVIGVNELGEPIYACLNKLTHLLLAGQTDSGKSVWVNQLILTLLLMRNQNELTMYLIDPKQVEFSQFEGFPQVAEVITDMKKATGLLASLINEMESRYEKLSKSKVKNIKAYNKKYPNDKMSYIVTVIDEYADLKAVSGNIEEYLTRLGQKARASGIHLVVATQRPSVDVIDGITKVNLPSKISFKLDSPSSYTTVFGGAIPYKLTGKGHGVMKLLEWDKDYEQFQGAIMTIDSIEEEKVLDSIKEALLSRSVEKINNTIKIVETYDEIVEEESQMDKLKRIIAETGEVRVGKLREMMSVRMNVVSDLMKELATKGWLIQPKESSSGKWEMNEECEELKEWIGRFKVDD